jgi:hypothetical protein
LERECLEKDLAARRAGERTTNTRGLGERGAVSDVGTSAHLIGQVGYVTVPIPVDGPGEVMLSVRGGTEAFAAWSDEPIAKHARVVVIEERSGRSVTVTPIA